MIVLLVDSPELLPKALAEAGAEDDVFVVEASAERLELLERSTRDPRVWYLIGTPEVLPLPDRSVDRAFGAESPDLVRVLR